MKKHKNLIPAVSAMLMLSTSLVIADDSKHWSWASLVGAWEVEVTVRQDAADCTASPAVTFGVNPFPALNTFHEDGTMSETGSRSSPAMRSPGHGVWERIRRNTYDARNKFQGFDANGFLANNMDMRSRIKLSSDGMSFTAVSRLQFSLVGGPTLPFCATMEGVRITL